MSTTDNILINMYQQGLINDPPSGIRENVYISPERNVLIEITRKPVKLGSGYLYKMKFKDNLGTLLYEIKLDDTDITQLIDIVNQFVEFYDNGVPQDVFSIFKPQNTKLEVPMFWLTWKDGQIYFSLTYYAGNKYSNDIYDYGNIYTMGEKIDERLKFYIGSLENLDEFYNSLYLTFII